MGVPTRFRDGRSGQANEKGSGGGTSANLYRRCGVCPKAFAFGRPDAFVTVPDEAPSESLPDPLFSSETLLQWTVGLLTAALLLDLLLARTWTEPFMEPSTWTLLGVLLGMGFRTAAQRRAAHDPEGARTLRWLSVGTWAAALGAGLLGWLVL